MKLVRGVFILLGVGIAVFLMTTTLSSAQDVTATPNPGIPTALPSCIGYHVTADQAVVRACAAGGCGIVWQAPRDTMLCVLGPADTPAWLQVDLAPDDPNSAIYYVSAGAVAPGAPSQAEASAVSCLSYLVNVEQAPVYSCAQASCSVLGMLPAESWLCADDYGGQYPGWVYVVYSDMELSGWVQVGLLQAGGSSITIRTREAGTSTRMPGGTPRATNTPVTPSITPPAGTITLDDPVPACQQYSVSAAQTDVRVCAGAGCESQVVVKQGDMLCVRGITDNPDWLIVDLEPDDTTSPLYTVRRDAVMAGPYRTAVANVECEFWEVIAPVDANLRSCPSLTCKIMGTVNRGDWVCGLDYGGTYNDWVLVNVPNGPSGVWVNDVALRELTITGTPTSRIPSETPVPTNTLTPSITPTPSRTPVPTTPGPGLTPMMTLTPSVTPTTELTQTPEATPATVCSAYIVNVGTMNVRSCPSTDCAIVTQLGRGTEVCVIGPAPNLEQSWYIIDLEPQNPANENAFISQNLVNAATPAPGTTLTATAQTATPAGTPTITLTPTPFVTLLPTAIFTPVPTGIPTTPLLAREVILSTLDVPNIEMRSPRGAISFRFQTPDDWYMDGNSILYLNLEYFETWPPGAQPDGLINSVLDVTVDDVLVSSISLNTNVVGPQTLAIPLPRELLSDLTDTDHEVWLTLQGGEHCELEGESRVFIRSDMSYFHFEYREMSPVLDLALYPRPLYNQRFAGDTETVLIVLPLNPTDNDLQVAARMAAGLGSLTYQGIRIHMVTAEDITDAERTDNHLLLVGQLGTNPLIDELYTQGLFPTTLAEDGTLRVDDTVINSNDGIVQEILNPLNEKRAIIAVTGQTPEALLKAAQALAGPPSIMGLGGPLALISETRPVTTPPAGTILTTDLTFKDLGYSEITLSGVGRITADVEFTMPLGQTLTDQAYLDLIYNYSDVLRTGRTTVGLTLNNRTPLASAILDAPAENEEPSTGPNHLRAWIPPSSINPGQTNKITITLDVQGNWECYPPDKLVSWFTASGDSLLHLPREVSAQALVAPVVGWFPIPFNTRTDLGNVIVSLPDNPTRLELEQALGLIALLGATVEGGEGFVPRLQVGDFPANTDLAEYDFIVMGRPTTNNFLSQISDRLPQPFLPGTDELDQKIDDVSFRLPAGYQIGMLQVLPSLWSSEHAILVITGTGQEAQAWAAEALLSDEYWGGNFLGNVVFVSETTSSAVDTRLIVESEDMAQGVVEFATESALSPTITPTVEVAYTVTPGPTFTPSVTPGPILSPTSLLSLTPPPTVPSPIPTFEPLTQEQISPTETELPKWFDILMIVTGVTLGFTALYLLIAAAVRRRRRVL